jgi:hypothetical protein
MVANPYRIWITDFAAQANTAGNLSLVASYGDRYIDLDQQLPIFQFIKTHEKSYQEAANLLYDSHPDLSQETLTTFLMLNTYVEIFWMTNEDPWQDTAIASWFEVNQATDFKAAYRKLTKAGLVFGPKMKDGGKEVVAQIPAWGIVWRAASLKVPVSAQGIGPNAILIGDLLEASRYDQGTLWKKYFPKILPSTENAVKIALDPALSILAVALAYDVKLRDLNEAVFFDPTVRLPANTYPSISDPAKAREYFKLTWVRYCKAFPEVSVNFPDYFAYGHNAWNIDFIDSYFKLIESVMGRPDSWPDLEMNFIPSRDKNIADYFGDKNNPMNMDALMLISLPRSSN